MIHDPAAYNFPPVDPSLPNPAYSVSQYTYYAFVTFTTLGYGDLVPVEPYTKSLAMPSAINLWTFCRDIFKNSAILS